MRNMRSEKLSKLKYTSTPSKNGMRTGESNGSLSTKPATSTTLNSTQRKGDDIGKDGKKGKGLNGKKDSKQ